MILKIIIQCIYKIKNKFIKKYLVSVNNKVLVRL